MLSVRPVSDTYDSHKRDTVFLGARSGRKTLYIMLRGGQVKTKQSGPVGAVQASGIPCQMPCVFVFSYIQNSR